MNGRVALLLVLLLGAAGAWAWRAPALGGDGAQGGGAAGSLPHAWPPVRGQRYPDLELPNHRGELVKLSSFKGKVIVVEPIGLACPACQAYAGAHDVGAFRGGRPQAKLPSFARLLERYAGLDWTSEPDLVYVHLLLYDMSNARAPTAEDGRAWAAHFGLDDDTADRYWEHVCTAVADWRATADVAGIPVDEQDVFAPVLDRWGRR